MIASSPFDELRPEAPPLPVIDALLSLLVPVSLVLVGIAAVLLVLGLVVLTSTVVDSVDGSLAADAEMGSV